MTFLDFEKAACENAVIYVKRRQFAFQLRQQIKDEQTKWGRKKKNVFLYRSVGVQKLKPQITGAVYFIVFFFI